GTARPGALPLHGLVCAKPGPFGGAATSTAPNEGLRAPRAAVCARALRDHSAPDPKGVFVSPGREEPRANSSSCSRATRGPAFNPRSPRPLAVGPPVSARAYTGGSME